jgi:UDP-glucose 4-epimerase
MRILVTGASGFIGRHVVSELLSAGHDVIALSRRPLDPADASDAPGTLRNLHADTLSDETRRAAGEAEAIVHLAGRGDVQASLREPLEYNRLNAMGTLNVLEGARAGGGHVVLASTQRVYRPADGPIHEDVPLGPVDPYAVSKHVAEQWCAMYADQLGVPTTVVRMFSVYGPGQVGQGNSGVVSIFLERAMRGEPLVVHADQQRDLTWVGDVARGIRLAVETPPGGERRGRVYNLATGVGTTLFELALRVREVTSSTSPVVPPGQRSAEGDRVADVGRIQRELGFRPTVTVIDGLRRLADQQRGAHHDGDLRERSTP